jgi:hypothetical protein
VGGRERGGEPEKSYHWRGRERRAGDGSTAADGEAAAAAGGEGRPGGGGTHGRRGVRGRDGEARRAWLRCARCVGICDDQRARVENSGVLLFLFLFFEEFFSGVTSFSRTKFSESQSSVNYRIRSSNIPMD